MMFNTSTSDAPLSTGSADPITGSCRLVSSEAALKLMTSKKNVTSWNTMSSIGVKLGSAFSS